MANLIIKSSADNLVLQGSDASPAITVGATGTTTFAENATFSGTANVYGQGSFPAGHVIQTVTAHSNTEVYAATNASWVSITGMAGTITPLYSNSKILIGFYCGSMVHQTPNSLMVKVTGTATATVTEKTRYPGYSDTGASAWAPAPIAFVCFDSPGTTNAQTYQLYGKVQTGTTTNYWRINSFETSGPVQNGSVIIQEIKV